MSLSPEFRRKYSELWYAIFTVDLTTIKRICGGWGIGQAELFASATLLKPWQAHSPASVVPPSKNVNAKEPESEGEPMKLEDRQKLEEERRLQTMRELKEKVKTFLLDVELVPKELIFIGRAMRILQANNQAMGKYVVFCFGAVTLITVDFAPRFPCQQTEHTGATCLVWPTVRHLTFIILLTTDHRYHLNNTAAIR